MKRKKYSSPGYGSCHTPGGFGHQDFLVHYLTDPGWERKYEMKLPFPSLMLPEVGLMGVDVGDGVGRTVKLG